MRSDEFGERLTRVEEQIIERRRSTDRIETKLDDLSDQVANMRSFAAGVSFAFSTIAAVIAAFWEKTTGH